MSDFFSKKILYILEDLRIKSFNVHEKICEVKDLLQDNNFALWKAINKIQISMKIISPDFDLIQTFVDIGKIKSHEYLAVYKQINEVFKNAITTLTNNLEFTKNYYTHFKDAIMIKRTEEFIPYQNRTYKRKDNLTLDFKTQFLTLHDVIAIMRMLGFELLCYAAEVKLKVKLRYKANNAIITIIDEKLDKIPIKDFRRFLSLDDKADVMELLGHPAYLGVIKMYLFPNGSASKAEATLDFLQEAQTCKKRRKISVNGSRMNFYEILTKRTPHQKFKEIVNVNDIGGFYCSVKSVNDDILYWLIDIDVSPMIHNLFPPQLVWELTINIAKAIIKTANKFNLPPFKISYSGSKGLHLLYAVSSDALDDSENMVNLPELAYQQLPGSSTMKKDDSSTLRDKFKFSKSLIQSLLLYTIYLGEIEIPLTIRKKLRISHPYQLFKISVFDERNLMSILLDTSSMGRGVFRIFSPHPSTKRVSIPIYDMDKKKFPDPYLDYESVVEDSKIEQVIDNFNNHNTDLYLQKPNIIKREHIRSLLLPHTLFPSFATRLRFGNVESIQRTPQSFEFWHRFFEIRSFYDYIKHLAFTYDKNNTQISGLLAYINHLAAKLNIYNKERILTVLTLYFIKKKISFSLLKEKLEILYNIEFFFRLKSNVFIQNNMKDILLLLQNETEFSYFLNQARNLFSIVLDTVVHQLFENNFSQKISPEKTQLFEKLSREIATLTNLIQHYLREVNSQSKVIRKKERLIKIIHLVSNLYFTSITFLKDFFPLKKLQEVL
jgi:hypothetical protein